MFITRENYEKALRRAKAEGRKEALREIQINDRMGWVERNTNDRMERLLQMIDRIERTFATECKPTEALAGKCECSSDKVNM